MSKTTQEMLAKLCRYSWPGNVRELDALVQRYIALLGETSHDDHLLAQLIAELQEQRTKLVLWLAQKLDLKAMMIAIRVSRKK